MHVLFSSKYIIRMFWRIYPFSLPPPSPLLFIIIKFHLIVLNSLTMSGLFATFARRSARTVFTNTRTQFTRTAVPSFSRHAKAGLGVGMTVGATLLGMNNDSYCFWNFFGSSEVDYQQVYNDVAAL